MIWKILTILFLVLTIHFGFLLFTRDCNNPNNINNKNENNDYSYLPNIDENDDRQQIIIDTDVGSDDALALLLAIAAEKKIRVIGITCTYGNTNETNVETNVLKVITVANRTDIPVYTGTQKPLIQNYKPDYYFGNDGLGDFDFNRSIEGKIDRSKHSSILMIEMAKKYPGSINIVVLGPLTNVAIAASLDSNFISNVKKFYVMGGKVTVDKVRPEFNFRSDPESTDLFFKSITKDKVILFPMDVMLKRNISKQWRTEVLGKLNSETMRFLNKAEAGVIERHLEWTSPDAVTVALLIWPEILTNSIVTNVTIVICDQDYRGVVVVDTQSDLKNVEIVRDFNVDLFMEKLLRYLN